MAVDEGDTVTGLSWLLLDCVGRKQEIVKLTEQVLTSIATFDWETYTSVQLPVSFCIIVVLPVAQVLTSIATSDWETYTSVQLPTCLVLYHSSSTSSSSSIIIMMMMMIMMMLAVESAKSPAMLKKSLSFLSDFQCWFSGSTRLCFHALRLGSMTIPAFYFFVFNHWGLYYNN